MGSSRKGKPGSDLEHLVMRRVGRAIGDFHMIEPGDRILVGISGGKDSFVLMRMLDMHRRRFKFDFDLIPVMVDAGWDPDGAIRAMKMMARQGFDVELIERKIKQTVEQKLRPGSNPCALCSRLRRGFLYDLAQERSCDKIALGHHLDDFVETLLLNLFYTGQLKSMGVNMRSDDGRNRIIRPLVYVESQLLVRLVREYGFMPVDLDCPHTSFKKEPQREMVRNLVSRLASKNPRIRRSMLAAMKHVRPSHLMDKFLMEDSKSDT